MGSHPVSSTRPAILVADQESGNALVKLPQGTMTFFSISCSFQEPTNPLFRFLKTFEIFTNIYVIVCDLIKKGKQTDHKYKWPITVP